MPTDEQLAEAVDSQDPGRVKERIAGLTDRVFAIDWAWHLFQLTVEIEAKHVAETNDKDPVTRGNIDLNDFPF